MLVKMVWSNKETWAKFIDTCVFAYNTSRHESTHFTPFELMYGHRTIFPVDINVEKAEGVGNNVSRPRGDNLS